MKSDAKMKMMIDRAKRTRLGRLFCRLAGEERGAVMMEYVVLGVMVVAAVVALVMLFGDQIKANFQKMIYALKGSPDQAAEVENVTDEAIGDADATGTSIVNNEGNNETQTGD